METFLLSHQGLLKKLDVTNCVHMGGPTAFAISTKSAELEELKLNGLSKVTTQSLRQLWTSCSKN